MNIVIILMSKETELPNFSTSLFRIFFYFKSYEEELTQWPHNSLKRKLSHPQVRGKYLRLYSVTLACFVSSFFPDLCFCICLGRSSSGDQLFLFALPREGRRPSKDLGSCGWFVKRRTFQFSFLHLYFALYRNLYHFGQGDLNLFAVHVK